MQKRAGLVSGGARVGCQELSKVWQRMKLNHGPSFRVYVVVSLFILLLWQIAVRSAPVTAATATEQLWGVEQDCTFEIRQPKYSIDGDEKGFDDKTASCRFVDTDEEAAWTMTRFNKESSIAGANVELEIAFLVSNWQITDTLQIQMSTNDGRDWITIEDFTPQNGPPSQLEHKKYDLNRLLTNPLGQGLPQIRFFSPNLSPSDRDFIIYLDEISLTFTGSIPDTETPTPTLTPTLPDPGMPPPGPTSTPVLTDTRTLTSTLPVVTAIVFRGGPTATQKPPLTSITLTPNALTPTALIPTAISTPAPTLSLRQNNDSAIESLWGVEQVCDFTIQNSQNSIDAGFNDQSASCTGDFASRNAGWTFSALQHTTFTHIDDAILMVRFSMAGWVDDQINLEISDGSQWVLLAQFEANQGVPPGALTTLYYPLAPIFDSSEKLNQASLRFIGVKANNTPDVVTISVDSVQILLAGGVAPMDSGSFQPTPADIPLIQINAPAVGEPHSDFSLTTDSCSACHNSHASVGVRLRDSWPEEAVCFKCHGSNGPGTNVQPSFLNYLNTATRIFTHNIMNTNGIHNFTEAAGSSFGGANRHIECEDCHDPHDSNRNVAVAPMLPGEMNSASGVDPVWSGAGAPASYTWLETATREYQVCLKCHSSYTSLPAYAPDGWNGTAFIADGLKKLTINSAAQANDSRDLAKEFNPNQASFHPVAALGKNQNIAAASFVNGWSQTSLVYCSDCHQNPNGPTEGAGPHGSPLLHILNGASNYSTVMTNGAPVVPSSQVCFQCHNYTTYVTNSSSGTHFNLHSYHMNKSWGTTCYTCHDSHGSEQQHLINFDTSVVTPMGNRNSQTAWYYDPVTRRAGCWLTCHNQGHDPKEYTP